MALRYLKKVFFLILVLTGCMMLSSTFAEDPLKPISLGLPFEGKVDNTNATQSIILVIKESIKYVGILAMMSLSWGGIQYIMSMGADDKVKKAKSMVLYSLLGVILSITAYTIIDIVNSLKI